MTQSESDRLENSVTNDQLFEVLSDSLRRELLSTLAEREPHQQSEFDPLELVDAERSKKVQIRLVHTDLPYLDELRLISWDPETGTIHPGPLFDEVRPALNLLTENEDRLPESW